MQGSIVEHLNMLRSLDGVMAVTVKNRDELRDIDGMILPGGESTTIGKLLRDLDMFDLLQCRIRAGLPVWGTCAGMILLAKEIAGEKPHLSVMDIKVRRNAYGSQADSFREKAVIPGISAAPLDLVFIRAPWIESVTGNARMLGTLNGHIIAARQDRMIATSFHPELTNDRTMHDYFISMVRSECFNLI